jgi:hypothetical protein
VVPVNRILLAAFSLSLLGGCAVNPRYLPQPGWPGWPAAAGAAQPPSAKSAARPAGGLRVVTEPTSMRRGDPGGVLIGPPHVTVEGAPADGAEVRLAVEVLDQSGIVKQEAGQMRAYSLPPQDDAEFRVRQIRVRVRAECQTHHTWGEGVLCISLYSADAAPSAQPQPAQPAEPPVEEPQRPQDQPGRPRRAPAGNAIHA